MWNDDDDGDSDGGGGGGDGGSDDDDDDVPANGLEMHTSLRVVNLTYISALEDSGSAEFLHHAVLFCSDVGHLCV